MIPFSLIAFFQHLNIYAMLQPAVETSTTLYKGRGLMSMEELDTLMASGKQCEESECSVDDVDMLIGELLDQQKELYNRVKQLKTEIKLLEDLNEGERNVDEIQETVRAIARIFQLGVSILSSILPWRLQLFHQSRGPSHIWISFNLTWFFLHRPRRVEMTILPSAGPLATAVRSVMDPRPRSTFSIPRRPNRTIAFWHFVMPFSLMAQALSVLHRT